MNTGNFIKAGITEIQTSETNGIPENLLTFGKLLAKIFSGFFFFYLSDGEFY